LGGVFVREVGVVEARLFASKSAPELLEEFRSTGAQAPFEEVVRRYAGMVYSVCLRVTKNSHDAEDATQAVFLALAVQGKTAKPIRYIGPWLQQVAHRLSLDIRRSKKRQKAREDKVGEMMRSANGTNGNGNGHSGNGNGKHAPDALYEQDELKRIINDEINQLPAKYRLPLILHYFGGLTREEMAKELNVRPNTLGVRVYRGRELLGKRLAARGLNVNAGALSLMLGGAISLRFNESLILSTCHAVAGATGGIGGAPEVAASVFANNVFGVTRSILRGMTLAKIKVVAALVIAVGTAVAGGKEIVERVAPNLHWDFSSLPTDFLSRLRDTFRSFVRPIQFSNAADQTKTDDQLLDAHGDEPILAGNWHYHDLAAERYFNAPPRGSAGSESAGAEVAGATVVASSSSVASSSGQAIDSGSVVESSASASAERASAGSTGSSAAPQTSGSGKPKLYSAATVGMPRIRPEVPPRSYPVLAAVENVVLGARAGESDTRVVSAGQSVKYSNLTVGDRGGATFRQTGGSTRIETDLTVARNKGSTGNVELAGGSMSTAGNQYIGLGGNGKFTQTGGSNIIDGSLFVGVEGVGNYRMRSGVLSADKVIIAFTGDGTFTQGDKDGDVLAATGTLPFGNPTVHFNHVTVADKQGSHGEFNLNNGDLLAGNQVIGRAGDGTIVQDGGTNTAYSVWLGSARQSIGSYVLNDGTLCLDPNAGQSNGEAGITIGGAGAGSFRMGAADRAAKIIEAQAGTNLAVRAKESGSGIFRGWGSVALSGVIVNNGQIIADGYGGDHTLDLSAAAGVTNTIENPTLGGTNGWFARKGGAIDLPALKIAPGTNAYSWGEDPNDALPDLVNSVRFVVRGATGPASIDISLLSLDRTDVPTLPGGHHFIGVWKFDAEGAAFEGVDLAVRYDDGLAQELGLSESILKLWKYENGAWIRINDESFRRYSALNILSGYAGNDLTYFAVSAPEPTTIGVIVMGGWMLMRRRRRD
jgi:RNA polymerase sigma factor (sigma-70 family)